MKLNDAVGDTIRALRQEKNMTLRHLATKSHVALGYLSEVERGHKDASSQILESIASGLDLTTVELVGEVYEYLKGYSSVR
jgi:transcriptional regulator with XRE-family HTH domain